jgi:hypothetical protein
MLDCIVKKPNIKEELKALQRVFASEVEDLKRKKFP